MDQSESDVSDLFRTLYRSIVSSGCTYSTVQILPGLPDGEVLCHEAEDGSVQDIAMTKKTYLAIFVKAHAFFEKNGYNTGQLSELGVSELWGTYYASAAILLTANEHFTALNTHQATLLELLRRKEITIRQEFDFATALVTSKLKRINKSSVLLRYVRRLYVALVQEQAECTKMLVIRLLRSLEVHFANYCAGYTLQCLIRVLQRRGDREGFAFIGEQLNAACKAHLGDVTLWKTYSLWLGAPDSDTYAIEELQQDVVFWKKCGIEVDDIEEYKDLQGSQSVSGDLEWLLSVQCTFTTPYDALYVATNDKTAFLSNLREALRNLPKTSEKPDSNNTLAAQTLGFRHTLERFIERAEKNR